MCYAGVKNVKKNWSAHALPISDFEPLPLYNHVHIPAQTWEWVGVSSYDFHLLSINEIEIRVLLVLKLTPVIFKS